MLMGMMIVVGFIVGFLVGCTGMGGIILIPALVYLSGLSSHVAMGTTLFTFIFTTSLCSWLYIRLGHVDWKATIPICIGGFLFTYVGADVKAFTAAPYLNLILALLILLAGALVFCPVRGRRFSFMEEGRRSRFWVLFAVGSGVGFVAGLTGAGGPVLSVPIMIALGFPPLIAIGAGQGYSVPVEGTMIVCSSSYIRVQAATEGARMLNDLGFNITVKSMEYTEYKNALLQGNFDLYYGEVRLSPNFDLSPFFGATGTLNYGSLSDSTMMNLCSMALVNSGNTYNLYKRVCERGYITPILFKSYALYTTRGAVTEPTHYIDWFLPYTPEEGN